MWLYGEAGVMVDRVDDLSNHVSFIMDVLSIPPWFD
jgi:hypothetical protein